MEKQQTLTVEQLKENDQARAELVELIQSEDAILMAGAGCSGNLYPTWDQLVGKLETAALSADPDFNADKKDFLSFADKVKECIKVDRYYSLIYETFKPGDPTHLHFHEALCRLPFKAITTTNYDFVLENAMTAVTGRYCSSVHFGGTSKNKIYEFLRSLNFNKSLKKMIAHLHGIYDDRESIILGGKEYSSQYGFELVNNETSLFERLKEGELSLQTFEELLIKYGYEWPLRRKLLWSILATRRVLFLGFSMTDPYFLKMLDFIKDDLNTYDSDAHFIITRVTQSTVERSIQQANHLKSEYGIKAVFYIDEEGDYSGLEKFISEIENEVGRFKSPGEPVIEEVKILDAVSVGDKNLTDKLFNISKMQYKDED